MRNDPDCWNQICGQRLFQNVAESPHGHRSFNKFRVCEYCEKNHSCAGAEFVEATSSFDAVHHWHANVQYQDIWGQFRRELNGTPAVLSRANNVTFVPECKSDHLQHLWLIIS